MKLRYGVIRYSANVGVTGMILEHSFHTNTRMTNWLLQDDNLRLLAQAEAACIAEYYGLQAEAARYELLNFNPLCRSKYQSLSRAYPVGGSAFSAQEMDRFYSIVQRAGVNHIIKE